MIVGQGRTQRMYSMGSSVALAAGDTNVSNARQVLSNIPAQKKGNRVPTAPHSVRIVSVRALVTRPATALRPRPAVAHRCR